MSSCINQPKGVNPEARIVLEGVCADYYNGKASWTFSNLDKIFGQTAWADHRFVNLECKNFVIPDPMQQGDFVNYFQTWRVRLETTSQAYYQGRAGAPSKVFEANPNFYMEPAGPQVGAQNQTTPTRSNGDVNDVLFYMLGDNLRQSTAGVYSGSEAVAGEIEGNKMCVAKEHLSQIKITIEMYVPEQQESTPFVTVGNGTGGNWTELGWADTAPFGADRIIRTAQFCMILMAKPVSPENRA